MKNKVKTLGCLLMCASLFVIGGCKDDTESKKGETLKAVNENDYASYMPYQPSDAAQKHASVSTDLTQTFNIGNQLMELSKEHFSPDTYTFRESEYLDYDTLDAYSGGSGLLGRFNKEDNPYGMNPVVGTSFPVEDGGEIEIDSTDVLLLDIYEFDWYKGDEIKGISLAFVLNDKIGDAINPSTVKKEKLQIYAEETARKTVEYLRKKVPAVGQNLPIYVVLYNTSSTDETLPGSFFSDVYYKSKVDGTFQSINEQWVLFPTEAATTLDGTTATSFSRFKAAFKDKMPYDVAIVGKGHYLNNAIDKLEITVTLHARSSGEVKSAIQMINDKLSLFATNFEITVDISSDTTHAAVIKREKGSSSTTVITLV
ncbi:CamS family sex pheromone protein [Amedibacillus sp. YH-ame10]